MRLTILVFIALLSCGCSPTKKTSMNTENLNGTWIPVQQEIGGTALPAPAFSKQQLIIKDTTYTLIAESVDKGTLQFKSGKMDIYGKEGVNSGKHFTAIYKIENKQLVICYNLKGDSYPQTFETTGKTLFFLSTFKPAEANNN